MTTPRQLKELYERGQNISFFLREESGLRQNTREIIELCYDLQAGSYSAALADEKNAKDQEDFSRGVAGAIARLCEPASLLEAGVGEATTLSGVLQNLPITVASHGFDLSWSRVAYASRWLHQNGIEDTVLCSGALQDIPFLSNSIDVVYTSHSIEPNGGAEEPILRELYRVARRFVLLFEPAYELASDSARQRMESHGYCRNLVGTAESLGYDVLEHEVFTHGTDPQNPTALTVIRKETDTEIPSAVLACPRFKTPLKPLGGMLFSPEALMVYPIIGGIPCLRIENGVLASKYEDVMKTF